MLSTSKKVFPGHNQLLATSADDPIREGDNFSVLLSARWLVGVYDLEIAHF